MKRPMCVIAACLLLMTVLVMKIRPPSKPELPFNGEQAERIQAVGQIRDKYEKNNSYYLVISKARISREQNQDNKICNILVKLKEGDISYPELPKLGRTIRVSGRPYFFPPAVNPGQFDLAEYEKLHGIDFEITGAELLGESGRADWLGEALDRFACRLEGVYDSLYPGSSCGIVKAMVLGDRHSLEPEIKGLYQRAGISHILCISGLHISLIGCALYSLLKKMRCPKATAGCAAFVLLLLYGRMTGMGISIFRAITMFVLLVLSEVIGRTYDLASSLALSCTIITITNPGIIRDSGFMLSFGAVLGIGLVKPFLDGYFPRRSRIGDALLISFSINVFTLPIVLYSYYQLSTYSMVTNLVLIPLMSLVLPLAILSGLFGLILPGMGAVLACPCRLLLFFYEGACRINDELPGSLIVAGKPKLLSVFIYYGLLAFILIFFRKDSSKHQSAALPARKRLTRLCLMALLLSLGICLLTFRLRPELQAVMLDIGQGDCSILQTRSGRTVMIDCGSSDESQIAKYKVIPYLKSVGTDGIDYAVVTHADADHISGLEEIFAMEKHEGVKIRNLILPDIGNKDSAYLDLIKAAGQAGCRIQMIRTGGRLSLGGLQLECLHPDKGYTCEDRNEYSTVLSVTYGDFSALYTGDIQGRGEEILTKRIRHSYTLLKCAHHGSENSTPMEFLHRADPVYTFISAGRENRYGHPHEALLLRLRKAGTRVYVTSSQGAITLTTNGRRCFVSTFIKNGTDGSAVTSGAGQTATAGKRR